MDREVAQLEAQEDVDRWGVGSPRGGLEEGVENPDWRWAEGTPVTQGTQRRPRPSGRPRPGPRGQDLRRTHFKGSQEALASPRGSGAASNPALGEGEAPQLHKGFLLSHPLKISEPTRESRTLASGRLIPGVCVYVCVGGGEKRCSAKLFPGSSQSLTRKADQPISFSPCAWKVRSIEKEALVKACVWSTNIC